MVRQSGNSQESSKRICNLTQPQFCDAYQVVCGNHSKYIPGCHVQHLIFCYHNIPFFLQFLNSALFIKTSQLLCFVVALHPQHKNKRIYSYDLTTLNCVGFSNPHGHHAQVDVKIVTTHIKLGEESGLQN